MTESQLGAKNENQEVQMQSRVPQIAAIGLLLWALVPYNPYGYYVLLRLIVTGVCLLSAYQAHLRNNVGIMWLMIAFAVLYNPIVPVHLTREIWTVINLITVGALAVSIAWTRDRPQATDRHGDS